MLASAAATRGVYLARLQHDVTQPIAQGYRPRGTAYSAAFTDALWAQVERGTPVVVTRDASLVALVLAAANPEGAQTIPGFLMATVAASSLGVATHVLERERSTGAVLRELLLTQELLERYDPDDLAAMYAETADFGNGMVGLEVASAQLFGKSAAVLEAGEAASLLVLAWTPHRGDAPRLLERRNALLAKMQDMGLAALGAPPSTLAPALLPLLAACRQ
jgi:hypothetical protein